MDTSLSQLKSMWLHTGAIGDEIDYLLALVRSGQVDQARIRYAALFGHSACQEITGIQQRCLEDVAECLSDWWARQFSLVVLLSVLRTEAVLPEWRTYLNLVLMERSKDTAIGHQLDEVYRWADNALRFQRCSQPIAHSVLGAVHGLRSYSYGAKDHSKRAVKYIQVYDTDRFSSLTEDIRSDMIILLLGRGDPIAWKSRQFA